MFTGLIQAIGTLATSNPSAAGRRLAIDPGQWGHQPAVGDSIAVNGVCLTVVAIESSASRPVWLFDAIPETLSKTTLGALGPGAPVNLEHAVTASTPMGGHFVLGHVDGVATVTELKTDGEWRLTLRPPPEVLQYLVPKGSVTLEGVSLTIAALDVAKGTFDIALIPKTLELTNLRHRVPGDLLNIEADTLAKTIVHHLRHFAQRDQDAPGGGAA